MLTEISKKSVASAAITGPMLDVVCGRREKTRMHSIPSTKRPAWIEIDLAQLRRNLESILKIKPPGVSWLAVVKDEAYGHGAAAISKVAEEYNASYLAVSTVDEAISLRRHDITSPIVIFGERTPAEFEICAHSDVTCCISDIASAKFLSKVAASLGKPIPFQVEVDTGMSRYGVSWRSALPAIREIVSQPRLIFDGLFSHFAMSDELDKSFAHEQLGRFHSVVTSLRASGVAPKWVHICNSGGFLDLAQAHFNLVRLGLLPLGVFPSKACRRIEGIEPVMTVKTSVSALREIEQGDNVGYGLRYTAPSRRKIAVLPIGYGDGFPRLRNKGSVLIRGSRAPVVGSNSMDAVMVDVTDIPAVQPWDEVVLMGKQGSDEITPHEIAEWKSTVSYEVLTSWRSRLPRIYIS